MKRIALTLMLGSAGGTHVLADDNHRPIDEPACMQIIGRISKLPLVKLDRYEASGGVAIFKHPLTEISFKCGGPFNPPASVVGWHNGSPLPEPWFTLTILVGNVVTGANPMDLDRDIRECLDFARENESRSAELDVPRADIKCQVSKSNGGGVTVTVGVLEKKQGS